MKTEVLSLTYGCLVRQIIEDCENDIETANKEIELVGYNMGYRMIDLFLAKTTNLDDQPCSDFKSVIERVVVGFRFALGEIYEIISSLYSFCFPFYYY